MKSEIESLFKEQYKRYVKRVSYRVGGIPNAEDVVMEAFTRALTYKKAFDMKRGVLEEWFNTILNNSIRDFKKDERLGGMTTIDSEEELSESLEDTLYKDEMVAIMDKEMAELGDERSDALRLYFGLGLSPAEIAECTNMRVKTIKQTVWRFKKKMQKQYGKSIEGAIPA
jgi:RNA polymerase sigma factor (sigma-70 family)